MNPVLAKKLYNVPSGGSKISEGGGGLPNFFFQSYLMQKGGGGICQNPPTSPHPHPTIDSATL